MDSAMIDVIANDIKREVKTNLNFKKKGGDNILGKEISIFRYVN